MQHIIRDVNKKYPKKFTLKTLWDRLGVRKPLGAFTDYVRKYDPITKGEISKPLWRQHKINGLGYKSEFSQTSRIRLLVSIIGRQINLDELCNEGLVVAHFAPHANWALHRSTDDDFDIEDEEEKKVVTLLELIKDPNRAIGLIEKWSQSFWNPYVPSGIIKNYYGEKIGMYFAFMSHYNKMLIIPGIIGFAVFICQLFYEEQDGENKLINGSFCIFIVVWGVTFLERWVRKEKSIAVVWGQTDFQEDEVTRPQYKGEKRRSPITDELNEIYYSPLKRNILYALNLLISVIIVSLVILCVAAIIIMRRELTDDLTFGDINYSGPVASTVNAIQIMIFNIIYSKMAKVLTDLENHRTQSQYDNSLILKTFLFQFVNSYNSLFYIAFFKTEWEGCYVEKGDGEQAREMGASCMGELYTQLITLFLVYFAKNLVEIGKPIIKMYWNKLRRKEIAPITHTFSIFGDQYDELITKIDNEMTLSEYKSYGVDGTIDEYMELCILFGYIILFAVAFPLSSFLAYFMLLTENKIDRKKLLSLVRRPQPQGASDIGTWWIVFNFIIVVAIFTNSAVLVFTAPTFDNMSLNDNEHYFVFLLIVIVLFVFRAWVQNIIPDTPERYQMLLKRHRHIVEKVLKGRIPLNTDKISDGISFNNYIFGTRTGNGLHSTQEENVNISRSMEQHPNSPGKYEQIELLNTFI